MSLRFFVIFLIIASCKLGAAPVLVMHPIHVSIVNMDISDDGQISFSVKLFTDDFESIINQKNNTKIKFSEDTDIELVRKYVESYMFEHLKLNNSHKYDRNDYQLMKMKMNEEAVWFYFKIVSKDQDINSLEIINSLMTDLYQDQTNLFILKYKAKEKAYSYNNSDRAFTFVLE